jgi:SAM-dependent methyltransferase
MQNCPLCEGNKVVFTNKDYHGFDLVQCNTCDFEFCLPYEEPGSEYYENSEDELSKIRHAKLETWPTDHPSYRSAIFRANKPLKVLDIGCSNGAFLAFAAANGHNVFGIDFDKHSLTLAESRNIAGARYDTTTIDEFIEKYPNEKFDVITMFMVLEHIAHPRQVLEKLEQMLADGGYFIGTVPNEKRYYSRSYNLRSALPPLHLNYWNIISFRYFVEKFSNYKIVQLNTTAHYGYVSYVWKQKMLAIVKHPLAVFVVRAVFTCASIIETALERLTKRGSGIYFEIQRDE